SGSGIAGRHRETDVPGGGGDRRLSDWDCDVPAIARSSAAAPSAGALRARARIREGGWMNCSDIRARLHAYVDGELTASDIAEVDGHCMGCQECGALVRAEREFRELLRRQPRDAAPSELRGRILRRVRRNATLATARRWLLLPAVAAAAAPVSAGSVPG